VTLNSNSGNRQNSNPLYDEDDHNEAYNHQLSPYNRLDVSISYKRSRAAPNRVWTSEWVLSVYNVYAHRNTQFYYRSIDPETKKPYIKEISFFPVIPTLTYRLSF